MQLGNFERAKDFIRKDPSSEWSKAHAVEVLLREGKTQEAAKIGPPQIPPWGSYKMLLACAQREPSSKIKSLTSEVEVDDDPEMNYFFAAHVAYCGQTEQALRLLKLAIHGNYCSPRRWIWTRFSTTSGRRPSLPRCVPAVEPVTTILSLAATSARKLTGATLAHNRPAKGTTASFSTTTRVRRRRFGWCLLARRRGGHPEGALGPE
jgi:hypothetical protein